MIHTNYCIRVAYYECLAELWQNGANQFLPYERYLLRRIYTPAIRRTKDLREFAALTDFCGVQREALLHAFVVDRRATIFYLRACAQRNSAA